MSDIKKTATPKSATEVLADMVSATKAKLDTEQKVLWSRSPEPGEPKNTCDEVIINGYKTIVPKGREVEIPRSVARILNEKYNIQSSLGADKRIDRAQDVQDALN